MKKLTLNEELMRIKKLMNENTFYNESNDNYADETFGDGQPKIEDNEPDDITVQKWYNSLNIDNLMKYANWEVVDTQGTETYGGTWKRNRFKNLNDQYKSYTLANPDETQYIEIRFDAEMTDSWPEQKWGLEQEPISAGYEIGVSGIHILHPIDKYLTDEEEKAFYKLNPVFMKSVDDDIYSTELGEYDGDY